MLHPHPPKPDAVQRRLISVLLRLLGVALICGLVYISLNSALHWAESANLSPITMGSILLGVMVLYALLMAVPFVPSIEIALSMLMMRGAEIAPFVYASTVLGLVLAFLAGQLLSERVLAKFFADLRLRRAANFLASVADLSPDRRLALLRQNLPSWAGPYVIRYRYLILAILLNTPGNMLIGGGGGICMVAGLTRVFHPAITVAALAIATAPVPLMVWFFGKSVL